MSQPNRPDPLARKVRLLEIYAACSSVALVILLFSAFAPGQQKFTTIDVERINVRNADGKLSLAIAGQGKLPGPHVAGKEYPQQYSGGRVSNAGMIFFNERGDEVGGLTYHGERTADGYRAGGGVTFDQFQQDQVVSLSYADNGRSRSAGVTVWDRSTEIGIDSILGLVDRRARAQGEERAEVERHIRSLGTQGLAATRVFLGSQDRNAALILRDTRGRPRLRLIVDSLDVARIEFVDTTGAVVRRVPE